MVLNCQEDLAQAARKVFSLKSSTMLALWYAGHNYLRGCNNKIVLKAVMKESCNVNLFHRFASNFVAKNGVANCNKPGKQI